MIGTTLDCYSIIGSLGSGGMGTVYLARDTRLGRKVALKVLPPEVAADPVRRKRFALEARSASALNHPHVAHVYDVGESDGVNYLVMECIEGVTLGERMIGDPLPLGETIRLATQIADALAEAHAHGIVHRDIKPANVMITRRGDVKVLDFGLARVGGAPDLSVVTQAGEGTLAGDLTMAGQLLGTVPYMSPEQARGETLGARSDVFSFGVVLYEMLAGTHPFRASSPQATLENILAGRCPDIGSAAPSLTPVLAHVVRRCLEPDPERRYAHGGAILEKLRDLDSGSDPPSNPESATRSEPEPRVRSLAVMPFVNASRDEDAAYLCDGMAENLIAALSRSPNLRVISRHATFALREEPLDIPVLGERLGVEALVLGELRPRADRLIAHVELVTVPDGRLLWSERYDRPAGEAATIEQELLRGLGGELGTESVSKSQPDSLAEGTDAQAYLLYLKGRSLLIGSGTQMTKGAEYLRQAAERDPSWALPHAALAEAWMNLTHHNVVDAHEGRRRAREAARTAVQLDPELPEAHMALGIVRFTFDWDWEVAEEAYRKAIAMGPGRDVPHLEYAEFLSATGRPAEALPMAARARELDPISPSPAHTTAYALMLLGDYTGAIREFENAIALHPDWIWGRLKLANALSRTGEHERAVTEVARAEAALTGGQTPLAWSWVGRVYAAAGKRERADEIAAILDRPDWDPVPRAFIHAARGELEAVLDLLEQGLQQRSGLISNILAIDRLEPQLELTRQPRFLAILERMGLELPRG